MAMWTCMLLAIVLFASLSIYFNWLQFSNKDCAINEEEPQRTVLQQMHIGFDASFTDELPFQTADKAANFDINEEFFNKLYDYAVNRGDDYTINTLLIGASHGGSDPVQKFLAKKYSVNSNAQNKFYTVMLEPSHLAFKDLNEWTQNNNILYNTSYLYLLNAAFNNKYEMDDNLEFYDWSDSFAADFPKEPRYILYQQGSVVKQHLVTTFANMKGANKYKDEYIEKYIVPSYCLQSIVRNYFLNKNKNDINMVFVDAQGFEYYIVKSILMDDSFNTNLINFELDMNATQHKEIVELFRKKGYVCWCPEHEGCCQDCKCIKASI